MKTQADFELTAEEMAELKAFLGVLPTSISIYSGLSDLSKINDLTEFKKCLSEIRILELNPSFWNGDSLPESIKYLNNLERLYIRSKTLRLPESIGELKNLRLIYLSGDFEYGASITLPESIGQLKQLEVLSLQDDKKITKLPDITQLSNLKKLGLNCENLTTLPENIGELSLLQRLDIQCNLMRLPESISKLNNLQWLGLHCPNLNTLPESIGELHNLQELYLMDCTHLTTLPENIGKLKRLQTLRISNCDNLIMLPESIGQLYNLQKLILTDCPNLIMLPERIAQLNALWDFTFGGCGKITHISDSIRKMKCFDYIDEVKNTKKSKTKQLTNEQSKQILKELEKQTAQTAIKIKIKEADNLPLTASKFGGVPYWLPEMPYPVDKQGNKLLLLAQINLSEMPPLPDFPTTGLLQFLMTRNIYEMNFYDNPTRQDDWRVVYHAEINPAIDEAAVLALNIPYAPQIFDEEDDGGFPVDTQYRLSFKPAEIRIGTACIGFDKALKNAAKEVGIKLNKNDLSDLEVLFGEKAWEKIKQHTVENLIGGYPDFTQTDPREERKYKKHSVLLLQIESDEGIMWGDCGVGNFFIRPDDLRKRDFSKVLFHWDCY